MPNRAEPGRPAAGHKPNGGCRTGRRWGAEETMATAKGPIGWDQSQFRQWESMQHHTALTGLAMLKANIIRERLSELFVTSGTAGRNDDGSDPETREQI